jgi:hypothetical protein
LATAPFARPFFRDAEYRNGMPDLAQLTRRLMRWAQYEKDRDLLWTPSDPQVPKLNQACVNSCTDADGDVYVGTMIVPENNLPGTNLTMRYCLALATGPCSAYLTFRVRSTGETRVYSLGSVVFSGTEVLQRGFITDFYMPTAGLDSIDVFIRTENVGNTVSIRSLSAWWSNDVTTWGASGVTDPGSALLLNQNAYALTDADSTYHYRTLARACNVFALGTPRMACNRWFGPWRQTGPVTGAILGEYGFILPAFCSSLTVSLLHKNAGATPPTVNAYLYDETGVNAGSGSIITSGSVAPAQVTYYTTITIALTFTPSAKPRRAMLLINATAVSGSTAILPTVGVWEEYPSAADLGIPSSERPATPYGTFPSLVEPSSGTDMTKVQKTSLIQALEWVWTWRRRGSLVCDSRYQVPDATYGSTKYQLQFSLNEMASTFRVGWRVFRASVDNGNNDANSPRGRRTGHVYVTTALSSAGSDGQWVSYPPPSTYLPAAEVRSPTPGSTGVPWYGWNGTTHNPASYSIYVGTALAGSIANGAAWRVLYSGASQYERP